MARQPVVQSVCDKTQPASEVCEHMWAFRSHTVSLMSNIPVLCQRGMVCVNNTRGCPFAWMHLQKECYIFRTQDVDALAALLINSLTRRTYQLHSAYNSRWSSDQKGILKMLVYSKSLYVQGHEMPQYECSLLANTA